MVIPLKSTTLRYSVSDQLVLDIIQPCNHRPGFFDIKSTGITTVEFIDCSAFGITILEEVKGKTLSLKTDIYL